MLSVSGSNIDLTSGVIWYGVTSNTKPPVSSASNQCYFYYHTSATTWGRDTVSGWTNQYYDTGSARAILGNNNYVNLWVYRFIDGDALPNLAFILGGEHPNNSTAKAETLPSSLPPILQRMAILVGRIIVQQGNAVAYQVNSAFTTTFAGSIVTDHNNLADLQGGAAGQYYHATAAEYSNLQNLPTTLTNYALLSAGVFTNLTNTGTYTGSISASQISDATADTRTLIKAANYASVKGLLGLGSTDTPTFGGA